MTVNEDLRALHALHERGVITPESFAQAEAHLLATQGHTQAPPPAPVDPSQLSEATLRIPQGKHRRWGTKSIAIAVLASLSVVTLGGAIALGLTSGQHSEAHAPVTAAIDPVTAGSGLEVVDTVPVGGGPEGVAVDAAGHTAYVTNSGDATVSVIDTKTNTVIDTIPVGDRPAGLAVDDARRVAFVANFGDSTVSVIDTRTNTAIRTIAVGDSPEGVAVDAAGHTAYVTNAGDATVSVIDTKTNTVTDTIPVGNWPHGLAVDPTTRIAYVANNGDDTISVIDTRSNAVTGQITVRGGPERVALDETTQTAYVISNMGGTVSVIDTSSNTVTDTIPVGLRPRGLAVDGSRHIAYVTNLGDSTVSVIDTSSNTVTDTIRVGNEPIGMAVTSTGTSFAVNSADGTVSVLSGSSSADAVAQEEPSTPALEDEPQAAEHPEAPSFGGSGIYEVGSEIEPGLYRSEAVGVGGYWERLSGASGSFDDIIANENANGIAYAQIKASDKYFSTTRMGDWVLVDKNPNGERATSFGSGMFMVGVDIEPGTYKGSGVGTWERLSGASGSLDDRIAEGTVIANAIVKIKPSDKFFHTSGMDWTKTS